MQGKCFMGKQIYNGTVARTHTHTCIEREEAEAKAAGEKQQKESTRERHYLCFCCERGSKGEGR